MSHEATGSYKKEVFLIGKSLLNSLKLHLFSQSTKLSIQSFNQTLNQRSIQLIFNMHFATIISMAFATFRLVHLRPL